MSISYDPRPEYITFESLLLSNNFWICSYSNSLSHPSSFPGSLHPINVWMNLQNHGWEIPQKGRQLQPINFHRIWFCCHSEGPIVISVRRYPNVKSCVYSCIQHIRAVRIHLLFTSAVAITKSRNSSIAFTLSKSHCHLANKLKWY